LKRLARCQLWCRNLHCCQPSKRLLPRGYWKQKIFRKFSRLCIFGFWSYNCNKLYTIFGVDK
jgi:hypothetical protein